MTTPRHGAVAVVVDHVDSAGSSRRAAQACRRWAEAEPSLAGYRGPAEVAAACRAARRGDQDRLLAALLRLSAGDEWAQLTILAGLADRLTWVVAQWARAGMPSQEAADAEAELVAACWAAIAAAGEGPPPGRPGLALVDAAWEHVRSRRRRQRHRDRALCSLPAELPAAAAGRPTLEGLAREVTDAVAREHLALRPAQAVYLTRVVGLSTLEAGALLGCRADVVRVVRARAEHRLAA